MTRQRKTTANRPSQADQEFVRNSHGEKVRNVAYDPKKAERRKLDSERSTLRDFARYESPTVVDQCVENIDTLADIGDMCFTTRGQMSEEDVTRIKEIIAPYIAEQTPNHDDDTASEMTQEYYNQGMFIRSNNVMFLPVTPGSSHAYGMDIDPTNGGPMPDNTPDSITFQERQAVPGGEVRTDYIGMTWGSKNPSGSDSVSNVTTSDYTMHSWYNPEHQCRESTFIDESSDNQVKTTEQRHDGVTYTTEARSGKTLGTDPVTGAEVTSIEQKALPGGVIVDRLMVGTKDGQPYRQQTVNHRDGSSSVTTYDSAGIHMHDYDKDGNEL